MSLEWREVSLSSQVKGVRPLILLSVRNLHLQSEWLACHSSNPMQIDFRVETCFLVNRILVNHVNTLLFSQKIAQQKISERTRWAWLRATSRVPWHAINLWIDRVFVKRIYKSTTFDEHGMKKKSLLHSVGEGVLWRTFLAKTSNGLTNSSQRDASPQNIILLKQFPFWTIFPMRQCGSCTLDSSRYNLIPACFPRSLYRPNTAPSRLKWLENRKQEPKLTLVPMP